MTTTPPTSNAPPVRERTPAETEAYARALLQKVQMEHEQHMAERPTQKHLISKKRLVYMVISLIASLILGVVINHVMGGSTLPGINQTQQVINSTKDPSVNGS